jgi:hypothetical protein
MPKGLDLSFFFPKRKSAMCHLHPVRKSGKFGGIECGGRAWPGGFQVE